LTQKIKQIASTTLTGRVVVAGISAVIATSDKLQAVYAI